MIVRRRSYFYLFIVLLCVTMLGVGGYFLAKNFIQPTFTINNLDVSPASVDIGEDVTISVTVTNTDKFAGSHEVVLKINGDMIAVEEVSLAGHASRLITFSEMPQAAGEYAVDVNGKFATFTVEPEPNSQNHLPNIPSSPSGTGSGKVGLSYTYSTSAADPDGDQIKYIFDWGDGNTSETGFVSSGATANKPHSWSNPGPYSVRTQAVDSNGASSEWSDAKSVTILPVRYTLSTEISPPEGGNIRIDPGSSDGKYDSGSKVTLATISSLDYQFDYWSGDTSGTSPTITITMDSDKYVIAYFVQDNTPPFTPFNPTPDSGARDISTFILNWSGGDPDPGDTVSYDVYFGVGTSPPHSPLFSSLSSTAVTEPFPIPLPYNTVCYWKVVATDSRGAITEGPLWNFTTEPDLPDVRIQSVNLPSDAKKRGDWEIWSKTYYTTLRIVNNESVDITVDWQGHSSVTGNFDSGTVIVPKRSYKEIKRDYSYDTAGQLQITYKIFYEGTELDSWSGTMNVSP